MSDSPDISQPPHTPKLATINSPKDLRRFDYDELEQLCEEIRRYLVWSTNISGGHFGAGLGVVELTVALHHALDLPQDQLIWDVGHQCYPHKVLTGRAEQLPEIRSAGGLAPFLSREESQYDSFGAGHASTSISAAAGMAAAQRLSDDPHRVCAVIGDGGLSGGMAFEALNHIGDTQLPVLVVLNDNDMSISENVGALRNYLARIWASQNYVQMKNSGRKVLSTLPSALALAREIKDEIRRVTTPGTLFEELGFHYVGPIDGHDVKTLIQVIETAVHPKRWRGLNGALHMPPTFLHVVTAKGKGVAKAEANRIKWHAVTSQGSTPKDTQATPRYHEVFGSWVHQKAAADNRLHVITPAMCEGSGLTSLRSDFPERYHDVAIAEQHAVTFAAGLACSDCKPVLAIYSTFLQRAIDQTIHDVALQNLDVTFAVDRAGLVGGDGATHQGAFDLTYLRMIPNMVVGTPSSSETLLQMLDICYEYKGPAAVRYPRGNVHGNLGSEPVELGKSETVRHGKKGALCAFGPLLETALPIAEEQDYTLVDMRWVLPLDTAAIEKLVQSHEFLVTIEENQVAGGAGSAVLETITAMGGDTNLLQLGIPHRFIHHGTRDDNLRDAGLDRVSLEQRIQEFIDGNQAS